jgi:uncharacterized protein YqiB (DUF1249 family)
VILDCNIIVSWRSRPRSFTALMALYESNYVQLTRLAGPLDSLSGSGVSRVPGDCELALSVLERARYTSQLLLTYLLPAAGTPPAGVERIPDLRLCLYHDARLLEATGPAVEGAERELDRRWTRNMMLNKWLDYCAERGHRFACVQAR